MVCAACGEKDTISAHVKDKCSFKGWENDRDDNIISLCRNCHDRFDDEDGGLIGISPDKKHFIILDESGKAIKIEPKVPIFHIKEKYVNWKNEKCTLAIKMALGLIKGYEHFSIIGPVSKVL